MREEMAMGCPYCDAEVHSKWNVQHGIFEVTHGSIVFHVPRKILVKAPDVAGYVETAFSLLHADIFLGDLSQPIRMDLLKFGNTDEAAALRAFFQGT